MKTSRFMGYLDEQGKESHSKNMEANGAHLYRTGNRYELSALPMNVRKFSKRCRTLTEMSELVPSLRRQKSS